MSFKTYKYGDLNSNNVVVQILDLNDLKLIDSEIKYIKKYTNKDFMLICILIDDWFNMLTAWSVRKKFYGKTFGSNALITLNYILEDVIKPLFDVNRKFIIAGYSLAGLFSLWSITKTDIFCASVCASPSVWYPLFLDYFKNSKIKTSNIYLSLGDLEDKVKDKDIKKVKENIISIYNYLKDNNYNTCLEFNDGNHFKDTDIRVALGISWALNIL